MSALPQEEPRPYTPDEVENLKTRVNEVLDKIRPAIEGDGGNLELIDVTPEGVVVVQLTGQCENCSLSPMTMKLGVERLVLTEIPEIRAVMHA